jgi:ssDNA-binding Zn-finger/Zn-ribbon topoisomerase 1
MSEEVKSEAVLWGEGYDTAKRRLDDMISCKVCGAKLIYKHKREVLLTAFEAGNNHCCRIVIASNLHTCPEAYQKKDEEVE